MVVGMDDLDNPLKRDIDNHMDDAELLPFRYQKVLDQSALACTFALSVKLTDGKGKMNLDLYLSLCMAAFLAVGVLAGYAHGFKQGKEEGYQLGRSVARHTFWSE